MSHHNKNEHGHNESHSSQHECPKALAYQLWEQAGCPEGQAVRWRDDNIAPTTTVGMPLAVGVTLQYDGDLTMIRFIEQVSGAKLNISYYA